MFTNCGSQRRILRNSFVLRGRCGHSCTDLLMSNCTCGTRKLALCVMTLIVTETFSSIAVIVERILTDQFCSLQLKPPYRSIRSFSLCSPYAKLSMRLPCDHAIFSFSFRKHNPSRCKLLLGVRLNPGVPTQTQGYTLLRLSLRKVLHLQTFSVEKGFP